MEYLWVWKENAAVFCKLSPKFETYERLVRNFNSLWALYRPFTVSQMIIFSYQVVHVSVFLSLDLEINTLFWIHCAFFLIPTLLQKPYSVCCPDLGTACSPLHLCLCAGWLGWDYCSSVVVATKLGTEVCVLFCSVPCRKHSFGFLFFWCGLFCFVYFFIFVVCGLFCFVFVKYLGILKFSLETEQMSLRMKT